MLSTRYSTVTVFANSRGRGAGLHLPVTQDATHGRVFLSGRITLEPPLAVDSNTPSARFPRLAQGSLAQSDAIDPLRADCTTPAADAA